jgi:hypothetical protein
MTNNALILSKIIGFITILIFNSCKKDDAEPADENELITTVKIIFKEGSNNKTFVFADPDGDGGKAPTKFETISLKPNTNYAVSIELLDESKTPVSSISDEVAKEKDEHLFIYTPSPANLLTYTYGDKDSRNFNVGLTGSVKTGSAGAGKLKVQLRHQPEVGGKPTKDGTTTPGSDDVNLDFSLEIK